MVFKASLLIALIVFTSAHLHLRSLEIFGSRRSVSFPTYQQCPECATVWDTFDFCDTLSCDCNPAVAYSLQTCITCSVTTYPTPFDISTAQNITDAYTLACAPFPGVPMVTLPPGYGSTTISSISTIPSPPTSTTTTTTTITLPHTTFSHPTGTITSVQPTVVQSTMSLTTSFKC